MGGKIHSLMDLGKRSMMNSQTSLQTVAHNISSKNVEGFTRQRTEDVTNQPIISGNLQIGTGARASKVTRVNNPFLDKQLQTESGTLSFHDSQAEALGRVEQVYNEQLNKGLNQYVSDFFNAFRELSNNPESTTTRTMVKEASEALTKDFSRVHSQLVNVQEGIDINIVNQIEQVNGYTKEIADLNKQISATEVQGIPANDQRDRRDLVIKKLNELIDVRIAEGDQGAVTVSTAGNAILVSGFDSLKLSTLRDSKTDRVKVIYQPESSHPVFEITDRIKSGSIGGGLAVRDGIVNELKADIDTFASSLVKEVNTIHSQGFDRQGRPAGMFFSVAEGQSAAKTIEISDSIKADVNRIATAAQEKSPGDNTVANMISLLQNRQIMDGGTATFDDHYKSQIGRVGVIASKSIKTREAQDNIVKQVTNLRESVSGVSLDEEATKMLEYQKAFEASARLIRTADEMLDTVLNLKR